MEEHASKRPRLIEQDSQRKDGEEDPSPNQHNPSPSLHANRSIQTPPSIQWSNFPPSIPPVITNAPRNFAPYLGNPMEYNIPPTHLFNVPTFNSNIQPLQLPALVPTVPAKVIPLPLESNRISLVINNDEDTIDDVAKSLRSFSEDARNAFTTTGKKSVPSKKIEAETPSGTKTETNKCGKCGLALVPEKNISFNGKQYHSGCFICSICSDPLESSCIPVEDKLYCERDYAKLMENRKEKDLPEDAQLSLSAQPAKFQIANYNIHPPPALTISTTLDDNYTVYVHLCEAQHQKVINGGIQSGDIRVLRTNQTTIYFNGLKLNKMGPIKTEMNYRNSRQLNSDFCIRFKIGNKTFYSSNFKLVSSCSQLTQEVRENVRPSKKAAPFSGGKTKYEPTSPPDSEGDRSPQLENQSNSLPKSISTVESTSSTSSSLGHSIHNLMNSNQMSLPNIQSFNVPPFHEGKDDGDLKRVSVSSTVKSESSFETRAFTYHARRQFSETPDEMGQWLRNEFERCVSNGDPEGAALYGAKLAEFTKKHRNLS